MPTRRALAGLAAVWGSALVLLVASLAQYWLLGRTGSAALLTELVHNFSDVLTAPIVTAAILVATAAWDRGGERAIAVVVALSAFYAGAESILRMLSPSAPRNVVAVAAGGVIGVVGNGAAMVIRRWIGRIAMSGALLADAEHARTDAVLSLGVVLSAVLVWAGAPVLDPVIGLGVSAWMLRVAWSGWQQAGLGVAAAAGH
jgi:divalent metal cation (Fe/Co/Zn/Cd) transporter